MDKIHCEIIRDLLPLYVDDVCSEKSRILIEKHLKECEECRKYYDSLKGETPKVVLDTSSNFLEGEFIRKVEKAIHRKITFNMVIITFAIMLVVMLGTTTLDRLPHKQGYRLYGLVDTRLDIDDIRITDLCQLESGEIYFHIESDKKVTWPLEIPISYDPQSNTYYSTWSMTYSRWDDFIDNAVTIQEIGIVPELQQKSEGVWQDISEIYYVGKDDEKMLIWEEGQELEKAPDHIEKAVREQREKYGWDSTWIFTEETFGE